MTEGEMLTGREAQEIIESLKTNSTILQMHLQGTHFRKLTVVTGIRHRGSKTILAVDHPPGFDKVAKNINRWEICFTFTGAHGIPYTFTTLGGTIVPADNTIVVEAPAAVERRQRRKHLRVKPPVGAAIKAKIDGKAYDIQIINISLGGALVMFSSPGVSEDPIQMGQEISDIVIDLYPSKADRVPVRVDKAVVRRVITEHVTNKQHYGLMFIDMAQKEASRLKDYIYVNQRLMLRKAVMES